MNFEFETNEDMSAALTSAAAIFNSSLIVNVEWSERKKALSKEESTGLAIGIW